MSTHPNSFQQPPPGEREDPLMAELADEGQPRRRTPWRGGMIILFMIALVIGPIAYLELPREMARWRVAVAVEHRLNGDFDAARASLDKALERYPDNEELYRQRAELHMEIEDYERALEDVNRVIELTTEDFPAHFLRSQIYQHLDRHVEAINDWNTIAQFGEQPSLAVNVVLLNGRAYARAVGGLELEEALTDVERALALAGPNAAMLDTRGFIRYLLGDYDAALADMELAVEGIEKEYELWSERVEEGRRGEHDLGKFERDLRLRAESVAVIRYHRALVYDKLGQTNQADEDRQRVRELGFEPNEDLF